MKALALAICLAAGAAGAATIDDDPRIPKTKAEKEFHERVVKAIHALVPHDKEKFALGLAERGNEVPFPGRAINEYERVSCERREAFQFYGFANELGGIMVAECLDGKKIRALAAKAKLPEELMKLATASPGQLRKQGWHVATEKLDALAK